jgi:threonylcarbamoyladenosine tRNA methylthiotransferase MtaB
MKGKRVAIATLGCKVNQYESAAITGAFRKKGYLVVDFTEVADTYIINTCSVTHLGDRKSRQMIRRAAKTNPGAVVAVAVCYAQVNPEEVLAVE